MSLRSFRGRRGRPKRFVAGEELGEASSAALEAFGAPLRAHAVTAAHFATEGDAYRFGIAPLKIEVLTNISGVSFDEELERVKEPATAGIDTKGQ